MTYSFGGFSKGLLLQELLLLTVVGPGSNQGHNGNSNKNTETLDPSVSKVVCIGKGHVNHNLDNGADDQKLEHEIVEGLVKQNTESSPLWWRLEVGTETASRAPKLLAEAPAVGSRSSLSRIDSTPPRWFSM